MTPWKGADSEKTSAEAGVREVARGGVEPPTFRFKIDFSGALRAPLDTACDLY